jgi:alpha-tubulin suppressor-like RCC1 family protein
VWALGSNEQDVFNRKEITHLIAPVAIFEGVKGIACGWAHVVLLGKDGKVRTFGRNNMGQRGSLKSEAVDFALFEGEEEVRAVESGTEFSFAVTTKGRVFGWGWNEHLNLS